MPKKVASPKDSPLVPMPSEAYIPQRDLDKTPILECRHLGIDFGGLTAVNDNIVFHNGRVVARHLKQNELLDKIKEL